MNEELINEIITYNYNNFGDKFGDALVDLQQENKELHNKIDKAINKLDSFIGCCKCEKLESGSDYLHHQYWSMFENFNKQVKEILKGDVDE